jgi:hypothetical protein
MSNFHDLPAVRPIERIQDTTEDIKRTLNQIKFDVGCIKSDLIVIKQAIKEKQKQEDEILNNQVKKQESLSRGWFFTY